jgi:REP element-mobilizing transposase RayT
MQTSLFPMKSEKKFGGIFLLGKRKSLRPLCTRRSIHLVLKSNRHIIQKNEALVRRTVSHAALKWGVNVYRIAVASDHLHLLIRIPTRRAYRYFIQRISGALALKLKLKWSYRPFTRIVEWGLGFKRAADYIQMNAVEALGFIEHHRDRRRKREWFEIADVVEARL